MAKKKKENTLSYLQMPLPEGRKYSRTAKVGWNGLNKRQTLDSGDLSAEMNVSTEEAPYLVPSPISEKLLEYDRPIGMFAFEDFIFVMYVDEVDSSYRTYYYDGTKEVNIITDSEIKSRPAVMVDYIKKYPSGDGTLRYNKTYTGIIKLCENSATVDAAYEAEKDVMRSVVQFNKYDTPTDPATGQYIKKLLIFPDAVSMYLRIVEADTDPEGWDANALKTKDMYVLYHYKDKDNYYSLSFVEDSNDNDKNKKTYKRELKRNNVVTSIDHYDDDGTAYYKEVTYDKHFCCDSITVVVKEFSPWEKETTDEKGNTKTETMNIPPDTASRMYYYRNSETNDIYRWVDDEADSKNSGWKVSIPPSAPALKYATVHLSRVFGVSDDRLYASGFNDYTNWNLDTGGEYNESNAWCSPSQANTKAGGKFTGITTFQNHVVCFKSDFMHEVYNNKNPFRVQDIYAEGAIDNRTIQDVDGKLIFVSDDYVKVYTGGDPRIIDYNLNMSGYTYAVSGTDGRNYYLYCEDMDGVARYFVYDSLVDSWSERETVGKVINFAHNENGMYMLCEDGKVYQIDTTEYGNWWCETDLSARATIEIKHLRKLKLLADVAEGSNIKIYALYDNEKWSENSHLLYDSKGREGVLTIRVKPRMTAHYGVKIHIRGYGFVKLYEMEIDTESGGELFV